MTHEKQTNLMCNMAVQIHLPIVAGMKLAVGHFTCNPRLCVSVEVASQVNSSLCPSLYEKHKLLLVAPSLHFPSVFHFKHLFGAISNILLFAYEIAAYLAVNERKAWVGHNSHSCQI